jgi:hypothetical protein
MAQPSRLRRIWREPSGGSSGGDAALGVPAARVHSTAQRGPVVPGSRVSVARRDAAAPAEDRGVRSLPVRSSRCVSSQSDARRTLRRGNCPQLDARRDAHDAEPVVLDNPSSPGERGREDARTGSALTRCSGSFHKLDIEVRRIGEIPRLGGEGHRWRSGPSCGNPPPSSCVTTSAQPRWHEGRIACEEA